MSAKTNCWESKRCGRQPGGEHVADLGVCPAATEMALDGVHGGRQGGRACWVVVGTLCGGQVQGTFAAKLKTCESCNFYNRVRADEGTRFLMTPLLLKRLREARPVTQSA